MVGLGDARGGDVRDNNRGSHIILALAIGATALYLLLAANGDLRGRPGLLLPASAGLLGAMLLAERMFRADRALRRPILVAAALFRIVAGCGSPALSDDVHRYVWDGRVQLHGVHPYRFPPDAPELAPLRAAAASGINHPELKTIYPPLAELFFLALGALGAGPAGYKLTLGMIDFGVVLALEELLRRTGLPRERLLLYAWNPLAVLETAGSGHLEPVGVLFVVVAGLWIAERRPQATLLALAAAVHVKLLPACLVPGVLRRVGWGRAALLIAALALPLLTYAVDGPALGAGLAAYAERWEYNATLYAGVEAAIERLDGSREVARLAVAAAAAAWLFALARRRDRSFAREALLAFGGVLLLSPTLHPWYLLWVLPWAAALGSGPWLVLGATAILTYSYADGDVPLWIKTIEFLPALGWALWNVLRARRPGIER